jgi:voltage-gated potassium channel
MAKKSRERIRATAKSARLESGAHHLSRDLENRVERMIERISRQPLKGAWTAIATVTLVVTITAGVLMRVTDPDSFPSVWKGLWWAAQTTSTVGYGDAVPTSTAGRILAVLVMLAGLGFLTISTAAISSAFIEQARQRRQAAADAAGDSEDDLRALLSSQGTEIAALRQEIQTLTAAVKSLQPADAGGQGDEAG